MIKAIQRATWTRKVSLFLGQLRNIIFLLFLLRWSAKGYRQVRGYGLVGSIQRLLLHLYKSWSILALRNIPGVRDRVDRDVRKALNEMENKMVPQGVIRYLSLPKNGFTDEQIHQELIKYTSKTPWALTPRLSEMKAVDWENGRISGAVYHGGKEHSAIILQAYEMFSQSNPLHPDAFPGVRKMEAEIVAMVLSMYNAPSTAGGTTTSGGTESILMACKCFREQAHHERGITEPEMYQFPVSILQKRVAPVTAHAAFDKAAHYFKIKIHHAPIDSVTGKVDIGAMSRLINKNTILIVGSAPNFPHGIIDNITALSKLALKKHVPLHVDACLGSFILPFLEKAGFPSEPFDFRLDGVSSISCDSHKYGFAPKGNSVIMYRHKELRRYQYFVTTSWPGGVYASPSIAGSRPGALIAGCWASLMSQGESGYISSCRIIVSTAKKIESAIRDMIPELEIIGQPLMSVVAFTSKTLNIYDVADNMHSRGWSLNALQAPPAIHIACTMPTATAVDTLITDLRDVVGDLKSLGKPKKAGEQALLYGVAGTLPGKGILEDLAVGFIDTLYKA